jgi:hypothetical protein
MSKQLNDKPTRRKLNGEAKTSAVSHGRHEFRCKICSHPKREEIEQEFLTWTSPILIAKNYGASCDSEWREATTR